MLLLSHFRTATVDETVIGSARKTGTKDYFIAVS
jgi:hypothetical protein